MAAKEQTRKSRGVPAGGEFEALARAESEVNLVDTGTVVPHQVHKSKTVHTVTLPDGYVATRTSESHVYSHVVAMAPPTKAEMVELFRGHLAREMDHMASCRATIEYVETGGELVVKPSGFVIAPGLPGSDQKFGLGRVDASGRFGSGGETLTEQVIARFERPLLSDRTEFFRAEVARIEEGPDPVGAWTAMSWASRANLAEKAASRMRGPGRDVRVFETARSRG